MEEFKNNIVQMLKANMDHQQKFEEWQQSHQQKFEERQQQLFVELHQQQIEFQQFNMQKTQLQQKQLVNSLNGLKTQVFFLVALGNVLNKKLSSSWRTVHNRYSRRNGMSLSLF